jgi:hypothetical protein
MELHLLLPRLSHDVRRSCGSQWNGELRIVARGIQSANPNLVIRMSDGMMILQGVRFDVCGHPAFGKRRAGVSSSVADIIVHPTGAIDAPIGSSPDAQGDYDERVPTSTPPIT